jgi:UDP-glucose 4-epimerase
MAILVTGGAGYIGSHTVVELLEAGEDIVIVDNFVNSKPEALDKIKKITGKDFKFYEVDILDEEKLEKVFKDFEIDAKVVEVNVGPAVTQYEMELKSLFKIDSEI